MGTRLIWGSNKCYEHIKYKEGVQTLVVDGIEKCPICEREANNQVLEKEFTALKDEQERMKNYNTLSNKSIIADKTLLDARFDNYLTNELEASDNLSKMRQYGNDIYQGKVFNIWLYGSPGVGKSHLSYSLLHGLNEAGKKDKSCLFIDIDEMLSLVRDSFNDPASKYTEVYFKELLREVDVLVLDDLGAETGNEETKKQATDFTGRMLRAISNSRQDKVTIITTNLTGERLNEMYDKKTLSRLSKNRRIVKFENTTDKRPLDLGF